MERPGEDTLIKYFTGGCKAQEQEAVRLYLAMGVDHDYITSCMIAAAKRSGADQLPQWTGDKQLSAWNKFNNLQAQVPVTIVKNNRSWQRFALAAAIACALSIALFWIKPSGKQENSTAKSAVKIKTDYAPGTNKALLILSDGSRIDLNEADSGSLAVDGQTAIRKTAGDQLVYGGLNTGPDQLRNPAFQEQSTNTLIVPKGGQYELMLPDGTRVWLNAASSLVFPVQFKGNKRQVSLKGEAYFEVAKNAKMPFIVQLEKMQVEVLGTHFNIMAYPDEPGIRTTLLEGSVKLSGAGGQQVLKPGQQGVTNGNNGFVVKTANIEQTMAWKNGQFIFDNEDMDEISRRLSRWYDVSFTDLRTDKSLTYTGAISKYKYVSEVLKMLEMTETIHYKMADGKVIVTQAE